MSPWDRAATTSPAEPRPPTVHTRRRSDPLAYPGDGHHFAPPSHARHSSSHDHHLLLPCVADTTAATEKKMPGSRRGRRWWSWSGRRPVTLLILATVATLASLVLLMGYTRVSDDLPIQIFPPYAAPAGATKSSTSAAVRQKQPVRADCRARYGIMLDAGSTGSRVHVYHFTYCPEAPGRPLLQGEVFEKVTPGLSHYAASPADAAASLAPLLDTAQRSIPRHLWASTPIALRATAGLRLLKVRMF